MRKSLARPELGQASIEAAVILPVLMLTCALLAEPACLGYTLMIMRAAAAETARVAMSAYGGDLEPCRQYALRRLSAVPEASIFHVGGQQDWQVEIGVAGEGVSEVAVTIRGHARPLPLLGVVASAFGASDEKGVILSVSLVERMRPDWLSGSYGTWQEIW